VFLSKHITMLYIYERREKSYWPNTDPFMSVSLFYMIPGVSFLSKYA